MHPPLDWLSGLAALAAVASVGCATGATAVGNKELVLTAFENAAFVPFDPNTPATGSYAVLSGDPAKGVSQMLFKYGPGEGQMHHHSHEYQAVVVKGQAKHWVEGTTAADAQTLNPGSYWSQPASQKHADTCLVEECVLFINWMGPMD